MPEPRPLAQIRDSTALSADGAPTSIPGISGLSKDAAVPDSYTCPDP